MRRILTLLAPLALVLSLAACGNKGPLVRPGVDDIDDVHIDAEAETEDLGEAEGEPVDDAAEADDADDVPTSERDDG